MASTRTSLALSFAEKYVSLFIQLGTVIVLARLLSPLETGMYSVAAGMVNIAQAIRDFGAGSYVVQEKELTRARLASALWVSVSLGAGLCLLFAGSAPLIAAAFSEPRLAGIITVMSLNFVTVGFASIGAARLRREMNFRALSLIGIASVAVHSTASIVLAALGFGAMGMAWASVLGVGSGLAGNLIVHRDLILAPTLREWRRVCGFGVLVMTSTIFGEIGARAPDVVIGRVLGIETAGFFSRGNGLITLFEQAFLGAVMPVAGASLARSHRDGERLDSPFLTMLSLLVVTAWPVLAVIAVLAQPIITVMFGPVWLPSVVVATPLCVAGAFLVVGRVVAALLVGIGAVRLLAAQQGFGVPLRVAGLAAGALWGMREAAWGFAAGSALHAVWSVWLAGRVAGLSLSRSARALGGGCAAAASAMALPFLLSLTGSDAQWGPFADSLVVAILALLGWLVFVALSGHAIVGEIRRLGLELRGRLSRVKKKQSQSFRIAPADE